MKKSIQVLSVLLVLSGSSAQAQNTKNNWSLESELVQPFIPTVNIIRVQGVRKLSKTESKLKSELLLGVYIRPNVKHDVVEKINEYMVIAGYRQYFWNGLHLEAKANVGYAWGTKNLIDGKDYETSTIFLESNVGYKINFSKKENNRFYLIPQFGVLANAKGENTVNIGPRGGKPDTFLQGNLNIGLNF